MTLRSSELCCRAASWRERERGKEGLESRRIWGDKDTWKARDRSDKTEEQGSVENDQWEKRMSELNVEGWEIRH